MPHHPLPTKKPGNGGSYRTASQVLSCPDQKIAEAVVRPSDQRPHIAIRAKESSVRAKFSLPRLRGPRRNRDRGTGADLRWRGSRQRRDDLGSHAARGGVAGYADRHRPHAAPDRAFVIGPVASFPNEEACVIFGESEFPPTSHAPTGRAGAWQMWSCRSGRHGWLPETPYAGPPQEAGDRRSPCLPVVGRTHLHRSSALLLGSWPVSRQPSARLAGSVASGIRLCHREWVSILKAGGDAGLLGKTITLAVNLTAR